MWLIWGVANHRAALTPRDHDVTQPEVTGLETGSDRKSLGNPREETGSEPKKSQEKTGSKSNNFNDKS